MRKPYLPPLDRIIVSSLPFSVVLMRCYAFIFYHLVSSTCFICLCLVHNHWDTVRGIIDRVYKHICGHSSFCDMRLVLEHNSLWSHLLAKCLSNMLYTCSGCHAASRPPLSRKLSIRSLSREFNDKVWIDDVFPDGIRVFHAIYSSSRYSSGLFCDDEYIFASSYALETVWIALFWHRMSLQRVHSVKKPSCTSFYTCCGIDFKSLPPAKILKTWYSPNTRCCAAFTSDSVHMIHPPHSLLRCRNPLPSQMTC